jgi:hypothetical protein
VAEKQLGVARASEDSHGALSDKSIRNRPERTTKSHTPVPEDPVMPAHSVQDVHHCDSSGVLLSEERPDFFLVAAEKQLAVGGVFQDGHSALSGENK